MKYILVVCLLAFATLAYANNNCFGCVHQVDGEDLKEAEETLNKYLSKLAAGDGPFYELVKLNSATTQLISGTKKVINADIKDKNGKLKTCDMSIWSRAWLENGIEVSLNCPGEEKVVKKYSD